MVPLCATCGEGVSEGQRCSHCDADPPAWQPIPRDLVSLVFGALGLLGGLTMALLAVRFVVTSWGGVFETIGAVLLGVAGVVVGAALAHGSTEALLRQRSWRHPVAGRRQAYAVTRGDRVVSAHGGGRIVGRPMAVTITGPRGIEAFAHYATLRTLVATTYAVPGMARVDLALAAALIALAARGRVALRTNSHVSWWRDGERLSRTEATQGVDVRRVDVPSAIAHEELAERTLLAALPSPASEVASTEGALPYRVAATPTARNVAEAPWVALPEVVFAMSGGDAGYRRGLRARMESSMAQAERLQSVGDASAALTAALDGLGSRPLATTLLQEIRRGFELRPPTS